MGTKRAKYYCSPCDKVVKAMFGALCPHCGGQMTPMGTQWRPGRRGTRTRMWDLRQGPAVMWPLQSRPWPVTPTRIGRKRRRWRRERQHPVPQHDFRSWPVWMTDAGRRQDPWV
jgi:hypothetical protein